MPLTPMIVKCCKIRKTVPKDTILDYLISKNIISKQHHGFITNMAYTFIRMNKKGGLGCPNKVTPCHRFTHSTVDLIIAFFI